MRLNDSPPYLIPIQVNGAFYWVELAVSRLDRPISKNLVPANFLDVCARYTNNVATLSTQSRPFLLIYILAVIYSCHQISSAKFLLYDLSHDPEVKPLDRVLEVLFFGPLLVRICESCS